MKSLILVCVILCFNGCSQNNKIFGIYSQIGNPDYFEFKKDSTFVYKYGAFHTSKYSSGMWKKGIKNAIVLNSLIKNKILPVTVLEKHSTNENSLKLILESSDSLRPEDYKCEIFINDTLYALNSLNQLGSTGVSEDASISEINTNNILFRYIRGDSLSSVLLDFPIRSIYIKIAKQPLKPTSTDYFRDPLITELYNLKSAKTNALEIKVTINDSLFQYKVFDNVIVTVKKSGIYYYEEGVKKKYLVPKVN